MLIMKRRFDVLESVTRTEIVQKRRDFLKQNYFIYRMKPFSLQFLMMVV